jgi:uncharacterized repeat protein (TIGR03803 family)
VGYAQSGPVAAIKVIHTFGPTDGPFGMPVEGPDGSWYGVLQSGGAYTQGAIYRIDPTGAYALLTTFGSSALPPNDPEGFYPGPGLVWGPDGNLYGTTQFHGQIGGGTVFRLTPSGTRTTIVKFNNADAFGYDPLTRLALGGDGQLYGATWAGGSGGAGSIFRMTLDGTRTLLHALPSDASEGEQVTGPLIVHADGSVVGTTNVGGLSQTFGTGTVFSISASGAFSILHYFPDNASDQIFGLTVGEDGTLFGTSAFSGGGGQVFSITPAGDFTSLHRFLCSCSTPDGAWPSSPLTLASDGYFYGTTSGGGTENRGTAYRMTAAGVVTPLHSFIASEGDGPSGLVEGADGRFYGITGGTFTRTPTFFRLTLPPTAAPGSLTATPQDGAIVLRWNAARTADTYSVYQGTSPGSEQPVPVLAQVVETSAIVSGLANGTSYVFSVAAVNDAGTGPLSGEVAARPFGAPTALKATAADRSVTLQWTPGTGADNYEVYVGTGPGGESVTPWLTGIGSASATVTGLTNGTTYYFTVASVAGAAKVMSSAEVSATPAAPAAAPRSGGGGALDGSALLSLLFMIAVRHIRRPP